MNGLGRGILLFLAGLLVGANVVYFLMRDAAPQTGPATATTAAQETPAAPAAATRAGGAGSLATTFMRSGLAAGAACLSAF